MADFKFKMGATVSILGISEQGRIIGQTHNQAVAFKPTAREFTTVQEGIDATMPGEHFIVTGDNGRGHGFRHDQRQEDADDHGEQKHVAERDEAALEKGEMRFEDAEDSYTVAIARGEGFVEIERAESALTLAK